MNKRIRFFAFTAVLMLLVYLGAGTVFAEADDANSIYVECDDCGFKYETTVNAEGTTVAVCTRCGAEKEIDADTESIHVSSFYNTAWSLFPPVVAIVLALITKEVYSSLFVGVLAGALFNFSFNPRYAYESMFSDGFISSLADSWNVGILIFLVMLGAVVVLMNKAGGSAAYGRWAEKKIKSKTAASLATFGLGVLIFVDDYFNCLTVGSVMRPVTDKHRISRAKLSYLIDATAAPVCMIAPISSWAAAVAGVVEGDSNGLTLFVKAIPFNLYSMLTFVFIIAITLMKLDFGLMRKHELNALKGDLYTTEDRPYANAAEEAPSSKGKVIDLIIPVVILIALCVVGMIYTGGFFDGVGFQQSFADSDASLGLSLGSSLALIVIIIYFICRRVLSFRECMDSIPAGFKAMVPAILILTFAWTLNAMTGLLGAKYFVSAIFESATGLVKLIPAIAFIVAVGLSFSTGTSWGTFGILIPIVTSISALDGNMFTAAVAACLAGAVCGDHCSPISDTTIMASTGGQCNHINHVSTQLPYALFVAVLCFIGYLLMAVVTLWYVVLPIMIAIMLLILFFLKKKLGPLEV